MIGISGIASYIPDSKIDNLQQAQKFGETSNFIQNKIGATQLPLKGSNQVTSDLAVEAIKSLVNRYSLEVLEIDALVVVTQNPDGFGLPHTAAIVQNKLKMSTTVAAFDVSLGCSGYVYGLSILRGLMEQAGLKNGVLVTADPYSNVINRENRITSLLFGDAATATWLNNEPKWIFDRPLLETDGTGYKSLFVDENHELHMNGRQVFNFAAVRVPQQINRYLKERKILIQDIDLYCLHQGSSAILDAISRRFPDVQERFIKDIAETGNTISSSIPLLLEKHVLHKKLNRVLICGFGVGLSWATNVMQKIN